MSAIVDDAAGRTPRSGPQRGESGRRARRPVYTSAETTQPILLEGRSTLIAVVLTLRVAAPPVVSSVLFFAIAAAHGVSAGERFSALSILVTVLSIMLLQPARAPTAELLQSRLRIALHLLLRWAALLASLYVIRRAWGYVAGDAAPERVFAIWALATPPALMFFTLSLHEVARRLVSRPWNQRSVVFVGRNETSAYLSERFERCRELGMAVQGFFDDRNLPRLEETGDGKLLGSLTQLPEFVKAQGIDVVFIALPLRHIPRVQDLLDALGDTTASLYYLPDVMMSELIQSRSGEILGVPVIAMRETPLRGGQAAAKRLMDVVLAAVALVALAPLLLVIAAVVKISSAGPVVFRQRRCGLDGREIVIYKFRTMRVAEDSGWLQQASRGDERITPFGRFLRRWSFDELPQLVNVLQGRMSLVGPRPHAVGHNEEYRRLIKSYMVRHKVRPGITGLAQIKGFRGETRLLKDMRSRVHYDLEYLRNWSLALDLKILLLTIPKLFETDRAY